MCWVWGACCLLWVWCVVRVCVCVLRVLCVLHVVRLACDASDSDNVERVTIQPETATEEAERGRRMSEAGETVTRQPVLVAVGTDRSSRTEISSSGSVSVRDASDTERVSLAQSGVSVRGALLPVLSCVRARAWPCTLLHQLAAVALL